MHDISDINAWLNADGPYKDGLALLKVHGKVSPTELFILSQSENSVLRKRLTAALRSLLEPAVSIQLQAAVKPSTTPPKPLPAPAPPLELPEHEDITVDMLPAQLKPLRRELKRMHAAYMFHRGSLYRMPDGMHLRRAAAQVVRLHLDIQEGWRILETWRRTGVVLTPSKAEPPPDERAALQRRNTIRVYLSRHKTGKRILPKAKLESLQAEMNQLESILNAQVEAH